MATMIRNCLGSWKCGKSRAFTTFPQALFFLLKRKYTKKFTMQGGEDDAKRAKSPLNPVLKHYGSTNLTIIFVKRGGSKWLLFF